MPGEAYNSIYEIAADQHGYVTARQAREAGVSSMALVMMERRQTVERVSHGVYRLVQFPASPHAEYMEASLWPAGVAGIISHESALALYGISDANPSRIHLTIPPGHRIRRHPPSRLRLHRADVPDEDVDLFDGIPVTRVERTIRDCVAAHVGGEILEQAIGDAERQGFLTSRDAARIRGELGRPAL